MRQRGFEWVAGYENSGLCLPVRSTAQSAGYDIAAAADCCIRPGESKLIPTGIKAYMLANEYLGLHIRSGLAVKQRLYLANGQGIIDADYYNNPDNEGHILIALVNGGEKDFMVTKGLRIAQGIFYSYLLADQDDHVIKSVRSGGIGSTGTF